MQEPIKVLEVIRQGKIGGGESHVLDLVANFNRSQVEPIVMAFTNGHMIETLRCQGVKCYVIETSIPFDFRVQRKIESVVKKEKIQLIHAHGSRAASNLLWTSIHLHLPFIYTVHGWSFHQDQRPTVQRLRAWSEKLICACARKTICVSANNRQTGEDMFGLRNCLVIENGVNLHRFNADAPHANIRREFGIHPQDYLVGFVARCTLQKAPLDFLKAIELAHRQSPRVKGLFVGEGDMLKEVKCYVQAHQLTEIVYLSPFRTDVPDVLAALDVYCLPSLWEGLSIAMLEAMAMKIPLIVTPTDGAIELIKHAENGQIVPFHAPEVIAEAIILYKDLEGFSELCVDNAFRLVDLKFNAQRVSDEVTELYQKCLRIHNKSIYDDIKGVIASKLRWKS